jgi:hypothetical protein
MLKRFTVSELTFKQNKPRSKRLMTFYADGKSKVVPVLN